MDEERTDTPYTKGIVYGPSKPEKRIGAKQMRREMTPAETRLWQQLRANRLCGLHFRRQQVLDGFIVDFYCHRAALVIEVDGPIHDERKDYDQARDELMTTRGLHVLRFTNNQIETEIVKVLSVIRQVAAKRLPGLPPYELPPDEYLQAELPRPPSAHRATGTPFFQGGGRGVGRATKSHEHTGTL
jgi:very-short-patch-repair endonuclease